MSATSPSSGLRAALEKRLSLLLDDVEPLIDQELARRETDAGARAGALAAERLNQTARRIRQAAGFDEVAATLVDAAAAFCNGAAVLRVQNDIAIGERVRGVDENFAARFAGLEVLLSAAPALAAAVESRDPVVAMSTAG